MIKVDKATIVVTEQTVREIARIIEEVKSETEFTDEPMPNKDFDSSETLRLKKERGIIIIASDYSGISFEIRMEKKLHTQESLGYHLLQ